jgi:hypothetical protein
VFDAGLIFVGLKHAGIVEFIGRYIGGQGETGAGLA